MIPKSISASSLDIAGKCLAMYKASAMDHAGGIQNPSATLGTTLHGALEVFVNPSMIKAGVWDWNFLEACYDKSFYENFSSDFTSPWYTEGKKILKEWYSRGTQQSDLMNVEIISREVKKSFDVPYLIDGETKTVPLNYIIDRLDQVSETVYRVVDYKSQRSPWGPDELRRKIQARIYALAVQIEYPQATEVWVQFDFLRYERVAVAFNRKDNIQTWEDLKRALQRIIDTDVTAPPETLNESCRYCPRKFVCGALQIHLRVGGVLGISLENLAEMYFQMKSQMDALSGMKDEIEQQLLSYANENDLLEFDLGKNIVKVTATKRRQIDRDKMAAIIGPELMAAYSRLNVSDIDEMRRDPRLSPEQLSQLNDAVLYKYSDPTVKISQK